MHVQNDKKKHSFGEMDVSLVTDLISTNPSSEE